MKSFTIALVLVLVAVGAYADGPPQPLGSRLIGMDVLAGVTDARTAEALAQTYENSGANIAVIDVPIAEYQASKTSAGGVFPRLDSKPLFKSAKTRILRLDLSADWVRAMRAQSRKNFDPLLTSYATDLAKHAASKGVTHFWLPTYEYLKPGGTLPQDYISDLRIVYRAIKVASGSNTVIAGPVAANDAAVQSLYDIGSKDVFDLLVVDAGTDFAPTAVDTFGLVDARRAMVRNGDGDRKMLVTASFPKADSLDKAEQCIENGLRNILTERDIYNPEWVAGALFTVNPNLREAVLAHFPPEIPRVKLDAALSVEGPLANFIPGKPYKLNLSVTNLGKAELQIAGFVLTLHEERAGALEAKPDGETPKSVPAGETATAAYTVTFPPNAADKTLTIVSLMDYTTGGKQYVADAWTTVMVTSELEVTLLPSRLVLGEAGEEKQVGMSVINHSDAPWSGKIVLSPYAGIKVSKTEQEMKIDPFGLEAMVFTVSADKTAAPGHYAVMIDVGGKTRDWVAADVPLAIKQTVCKVEDAKNPPDIKLYRTVESGKREVVAEGHFGYDEQNFYALFVVNDTKHVDLRDPKDILSGDSVILAFDPLMNGARTQGGGFQTDDYEYGFANTKDGAEVIRLAGPPDKPKGVLYEVRFPFSHQGDKSQYLITIPWSVLAPIKPTKGATFGMSVLINQHDGVGRHCAEWGGGIEPKQDPRMFVPVVLQ